jgi:hypothetical protein
MECVACGSRALVRGTITHPGMEPVKFSPVDASVIAKCFGVNARALKAVACTHSSQVQLSIDFTEDDLKQYRSFEGDPPTAIEPVDQN